MLAGCLFTQFTFADATITVTNSADTGPGTLRQAIADSISGDTIGFAIDDTNTIALTSGPLLITNDLTIVASNASIAIDAGGNSRVLEISARNIVTLDSLIFTNGNVPDNGGGILVDGGATLTLTNCIVAGNFAVAGGGVFISPGSTVAIKNSIFSGNIATNNGGAIDNETNATVVISDSVFTGNSALQGGAVFNDFATNVLNHCTFSTNSAENGGAIANFDSALIATNLIASSNFAAAGGGIYNANSNGILTLTDSTLIRNIGTNFAGGIMNTNGSVATISGTTISENASPADQGGGIENLSSITINNCTISGSPSGGGFVNLGGTAVCNNSTLFGNVALFDGGGVYAFFGVATFINCTISGNSALRRAGGIYENSSSLFLTNTIIAGNTAITSDPNFVGSFSGANNLTNGNPLLAPLGDYGGPTQTMPPLGGSPAINAGLDFVTNFLTTDQRGFPRAGGSHVDIGAVEIQPAVVVNVNDDGPGSLRAAASSAAELIAFSNTLSGQTIHFTSGQITLSNSVGIDASGLAGGIVLDGGGIFRVLEITASNMVTLGSLTITNGNAAGNGGGILVDDDVTLMLANCTVAGNLADAGGGVFISTNSNVTIKDSIVSGNSSTNGGGISLLSGSLNVNNSTMSGNTASESGGGVAISGGQATLNNCTLFGNSTGGTGGGVAISPGATNLLNNCTLTGNSAGTGGGIWQDAGSVSVLLNTIAAGNTATNAPDIFGIFSGSNNLTNGIPKLAPLGNYGGATQTMPPLFGSPAVDAGLDSAAASLITDQRGYPRRSGAHIDIGAVETQMPPVNDRPHLRLSRLQPGGMASFGFNSISNGDFTVLSSTNLNLPLNQWDILGSPTETLPGVYQFADPATANSRVRFYQVVSP